MKEPIYLQLCIRGPNADVIAMLVSNARALDVKLQMNAVAVGIEGEEFARNSEWRRIRVLRVVNTFRPCKRTGRQFSEIDFLMGVIIEFRYDKIGRVAALALFHTHCLSESFPHAIFPRQIIFFHGLVVITLASFADAHSSHVGECSIHFARDSIVMLVCPISETEDDVLQAFKTVRAIGEVKVGLEDVLREGDGVIGRLTLTIGGHDEEDAAVLWDLVEVFKVVLFGVAHEGGKAKFLLRLFGKTNSVFLRSAGL